MRFLCILAAWILECRIKGWYSYDHGYDGGYIFGEGWYLRLPPITGQAHRRKK